jgi:hypothetical protein
MVQYFVLMNFLKKYKKKILFNNNKIMEDTLDFNFEFGKGNPLAKKAMRLMWKEGITLKQAWKKVQKKSKAKKTNSKTIIINGRKHKLYTGPNGGHYYKSKNRKVYVNNFGGGIFGALKNVAKEVATNAAMDAATEGAVKAKKVALQGATMVKNAMNPVMIKEALNQLVQKNSGGFPPNIKKALENIIDKIDDQTLKILYYVYNTILNAGSKFGSNHNNYVGYPKLVSPAELSVGATNEYLSNRAQNMYSSCNYKNFSSMPNSGAYGPSFKYGKKSRSRYGYGLGQPNLMEMMGPVTNSYGKKVRSRYGYGLGQPNLMEMMGPVTNSYGKKARYEKKFH